MYGWMYQDEKPEAEEGVCGLDEEESEADQKEMREKNNVN